MRTDSNRSARIALGSLPQRRHCVAHHVWHPAFFLLIHALLCEQVPSFVHENFKY